MDSTPDTPRHRRRSIRWIALAAAVVTVPTGLAVAGTALYGEEILDQLSPGSSSPTAQSNGSTELPPPPPPPGNPPAGALPTAKARPTVRPVSVTARGDSVSIAGNARSEVDKQRLLTAVQQAAGKRSVVDAITTEPGFEPPAPIDATVAMLNSALTSSMDRLDLKWDAERVTVVGMARNQDQKSALEQQITAVAPGAALDSQLAVSPYAGTNGINPKSVQTDVNRLLAGLGSKGVTFSPGTTNYVKHGEHIQHELTKILLAAPGATIQLIAHAWNGETESHRCDVLAMERAAIVRDFLVSQGIPRERIRARPLVEPRWGPPSAGGPQIEFVVGGEAQ